jgi:hypothetical protein
MRAIPTVILLSVGICLPQVSSTVSLSNGVELRIGANLGAPAGGDGLKVELAPASGNSFYRIFRDQSNLAVFAYELAVTRAAGRDEFQLTVKPAGTEFAARFQNSDGGKPVPTLATTRDLPPLRSGQPAEIDLFELAGSGHPITDVIQLNLNDPLQPQAAGRLRFSGLKVSVNRTLVSTTDVGGSVSGRYAMFYIPGRGGYFFSTDAVAGRAFVTAGWIDRTRMQFTLDNDTYDCVAGEPILVRSERGEIWVYHDPAYKPEGNWTSDVHVGKAQTSSDAFFTAASDSLNWWLQ